jgi:16S rRNA (uracil1498-N3)-methyltransferase
MNTRRFFTDADLEPSSAGQTIPISGDEYHHLKHVNRARCGDRIEIIDGRGSLYSGEIRAFKTHEVLVDVKIEERTGKPPVNIIIAPSLLKQRPMGILVEKLTEMGVDEIRPVIFQRTDETFNPSRLKKWHKQAVQSLKVNKRLWYTDIYAPVTIDELMDVAAPVATKLLLDIDADPGAPQEITGDSDRQFPVIAVVGPPGDFTGEERQRLIDHGFVRYNLNDSVLKTETAAISIAAILKCKLSYRNTI